MKINKNGNGGEFYDARMRQSKIIEVIEARNSGAILQSYSNDDKQWHDIIFADQDDEDPIWNFGYFEYRVKPMPVSEPNESTTVNP